MNKWSLTRTTTLGESALGSNDSKGILHTPQKSLTEASPSDAVKCYTQEIPFWIQSAYSRTHWERNNNNNNNNTSSKKTMKTWRVELTAGGKSLAETKIQRGIFQGDALSPILFIIAMMPLNHILRKCTAGYKLSRSQEKVNHLIYIDDIKLFAKNENELETNTHN